MMGDLLGCPLPHGVGLSTREAGAEKGVEFLGHFLFPSPLKKIKLQPLSLDLLHSGFICFIFLKTGSLVAEACLLGLTSSASWYKD